MDMATTAGHRQRDKGESKVKKRKGAGRKRTVHDLPEHVLEPILFRLGPYSPYLVRAAATCPQWFSVVADAGFLARLVTAAPPHAGDYRTVEGSSLFFPSSPLNTDGCHRFSLDFLPDSESWELQDSRGSLLLLSKKSTCDGESHDDDFGCCWCPNLIVCDPFRKRYLEILRPPDLYEANYLGLFLADGNDGNRAGRNVSMSNFKIIVVLQASAVSALTTGSDGCWDYVHSEFPDDLGTISAYFFAGRANGSLYWGLEEDKAMVLVLDEATAVFSFARFPDSVWGLSDNKTARLIGGKDGLLHVVRLIDKVLKVFTRTHLGCSDDDDNWVLEKQLSLLEATIGLPGRNQRFLEQQVIIIMANDEYILLSLSDETWVFTVELNPMRVEREHNRNMHTGNVYPYKLPWPPVL